MQKWFKKTWDKYPRYCEKIDIWEYRWDIRIWMAVWKYVKAKPVYFCIPSVDSSPKNLSNLGKLDKCQERKMIEAMQLRPLQSTWSARYPIGDLPQIR